MLRKRLLSALVGIPLIVTAVWQGGFFLLAMAALIYWLGSRELLKMFYLSGLSPSPFLVYAGGLILLVAVFTRGSTYSIASLTGLVFMYLFSMLFFRDRETLVSVAVTFFSTVYMGLISYIYLLHNLPEGRIWLILALVCTWAGDTAAYFGGKQFGRVPLARRISPGKTREGALFGILGSMLAAYLFTFAHPPLQIFSTVGLGFLIAVAGQLGDLVESSIKRQAGVKDAGKLIPGHGGILDRFDSLLFTAPLVYYYVYFLI